MSNCVYYSCSGCMQTKRGYELFFLPNWCPHRCKWQRRWLQIQRQSLRLHISWSFDWPNAPQCHLMCYVLRSCQWFGSEMWHIFCWWLATPLPNAFHFWSFEFVPTTSIGLHILVFRCRWWETCTHSLVVYDNTTQWSIQEDQVNVIHKLQQYWLFLYLLSCLNNGYTICQTCVLLECPHQRLVLGQVLFDDIVRHQDTPAGQILLLRGADKVLTPAETVLKREQINQPRLRWPSRKPWFRQLSPTWHGHDW